MGESRPRAGLNSPKRIRGAARHGRWSHWVAVAAGLGYVPIAPGTAGSLLGVLLFLGFAFGVHAVGMGPLPVAPAGFSLVGSSWLPVGSIYLLGVVVLFCVGVWASGRAELAFDRHDDNRIVIDEVVGQLITLAPLLFFPFESLAASPVLDFGTSVPHLSDAGGVDFFPFFLWVVTGFVLFRLFDIWKPGAIRWAERRFEGGLGVMADDGLAGIYAAATLTASVLFIAPQALGNRIGGLG